MADLLTRVIWTAQTVTVGPVPDGVAKRGTDVAIPVRGAISDYTQVTLRRGGEDVSAFNDLWVEDTYTELLWTVPDSLLPATDYTSASQLRIALRPIHRNMNLYSRRLVLQVRVTYQSSYWDSEPFSVVGACITLTRAPCVNRGHHCVDMRLLLTTLLCR